MSSVEPGGSEVEHPHESSSGSRDSRSSPQLPVCFGLYEVNLQAGELRKGGLKLRIPRQSFQILAMLLGRPGEVITREDLRRELWPSDVFVNFERSLNSAMQKLRSVLGDTARKPRYIETLPREGYRFIASVGLRTSSAEVPQGSVTLDSAELLSVIETSDELSGVIPVPSRNWRVWVATALLVFLVFLGGYSWNRHSRRNQPVPERQSTLVIPASFTRPSVAVMGFTNVSGNTRNLWLSTAFTEMLATELAAGDHLRTVAAEHVARAKLELSLANEDSYAGDTLSRIHKDLGCDYVVAGSYLAIGDSGKGQLRLDARVQDARTGETVASVAVVGSRDELFNLASRAGEQLRAKLGAGTLTSTEAEEVKAALPSDPEAARLYSDGLARLRLYDNVAARDLFEKVVRLQPEYSPAYSALASAWLALGYDSKAAAAAQKAVNLAGSLLQQARLQTEARSHEISGEWTQAVEAYSRLQRSYPDNLDYGLSLGTAQFNMGNGAEAAATIAALRKLPPPERDDPRIDLTEAAIAGDLADSKREQTLAESAARKSEIAGARLLLARSKLVEGFALDDQGNFNAAMDAYAAAQRIFADSGSLGDSATALMNIGGVLAKQGDLAGAKHKTEEALNVFRKNGDQASLAAAVSNLGEIYQSQGELPKAQQLVRESLTIFNKLNMKSKQEISIYNLADLLQQQGKLREAKEMLEPLAEHLRSGGNKSLLGATIETLGLIDETQGELPTALQMFQGASALFKETGDKAEYAGAERSLGRAFLREGDLVSARRAISESLSVDSDIGAKADAALSQVALSELDLAQGVSLDSATLRSAIDELRLRKITDEQIEAEIDLARESIQQGKAAEAASTLREAAALSSKSYNPIVGFDVALATARLRVVQHRFDDARRTIRPALQRATAAGCTRCQLEARLELGEIEIHTGSVERGRDQLRDLADESGRRGFRLIAEAAAADSK
jgi:tetratricopeptide (TPR) repeat protein/DNA-binding winged helix-turn-helix (wHTH) protein